MSDVMKMLSAQELSDVVERGDKLATAVEASLERAYGGMIKMGGTITAERGVGMLENLEAGEMANEARSIAGSIAESAKRFYVLHQRMRDAAGQYGVKVPSP